jgi:chemotaxis family two-component system response regulator Rcp1
MFPKQPIKPINILLVEDSLADIRLTREALEDGKINNILNVVMDGEEAMLYLKKLGKYPDFPTPDLILLDLNLPKMDGKDVLAQIKADSKLSSIPVIILTTSSSEHDILDTYTNHANSYLIKPVDFDQLVNLVKSIEDFWFTIVKLPNSEK